MINVNILKGLIYLHYQNKQHTLERFITSMSKTTVQSGYSTDYKLCYSSDIQTLIGMLRKNSFDEKDPGTVTLLNALSMSVKKWKAPTGFYYAVKYTKNVFQPMYSSDMSCVNQQLVQAPSPACTDASIQGRGLFRSVIFNCEGNIVSFSPAKTLRCNDATDINSINALSSNDFFGEFSHIEEFVEGTMIHLFRASETRSNPTDTNSSSDALSLSGWEISTKGVVGGGVFVPSPSSSMEPNSGVRPTFRSLFIDACIASKIDLHTLDKRYSYSLVLQHPKNPMIAPVVTPRIFYIAAYTVDNTTLTVSRHARSVIDWKGAGFYVPRNYAIGLVDPAFQCLQRKYVDPNGLTPYRVMGVMFHGSKHSGWSFKLRNPAYENAKKTPLDGDARLFYMYCSLRRSKEIKQHLSIFPEDTESFAKFNDRISNFAKFLHKTYVDCIILKTASHALCGSKYVKAIIHGIHNDIYRARKSYIASQEALKRPDQTNEHDDAVKMTPSVKVTLPDVLHYITNIISPIDLFCGITTMPPLSISNQANVTV